jgi:hypothetical protein
MEQRLTSICRAYYQRFAASPTVTLFETILPVRGGRSGTGVSIGENRPEALNKTTRRLKGRISGSGGLSAIRKLSGSG